MKIDASNRFRLHENGHITIISRHSKSKEGYFSYCLNYSESDYHKTRVETGKKTKTYSIDSNVYRKIASSAVRMWHERKYEIIEFTLTFPCDIDEGPANECFSKFINNLENNYRLNAHIAVRELTPKGRLHYHLIGDLPYAPVKKFNQAWCHAFNEYFPGSPNALRLGSPKYGRIVHDVGQMVNYMCKYMTKCKNQKFSTRCYFISHNITSRPQDLRYDDFLAIVKEYRSKTRHYEYCTLVVLFDTTSKRSNFWDWFGEYCHDEVEYPLKTCTSRSEAA